MSKKLLCLIVVSAFFASCESKRSRSEIDHSLRLSGIGLAAAEYWLQKEKDAGPAALQLEKFKEAKAEADKFLKEAEESGHYLPGEAEQSLQVGKNEIEEDERDDQPQ